MPVEVKVHSDLDAVAADAGGLLDRAAQPSIFDRLDWFRLTLAHGPMEGEPFILRARDGAASCWLFLMRKGNAAAALSSWYSLRAAPIFSQFAGENAHILLLNNILYYLRTVGKIASLTLGPIEPELTNPILSAARSAGWKGHAGAARTNWRVDLRDRDFAAYWRDRPARLRNTFQRQSRRAGMEISIHRTFDPDGWNAYEEVHARSWKPPEGSPAFLRALAEQEGAAGTLRLGIGRIAGEPAAAQLWRVEHGVATIHKLAYAEPHRALSPGTLLSAAMFREAIDVDRVARIDFGLGAEPYKADWMEERRLLPHVSLFNLASLSGLAGLLRARAGRLVRAARSR